MRHSQAPYTAEILRKNSLSHPYWKDCNPLNKADEQADFTYLARRKAQQAWAKTKGNIAECLKRGNKVIYL